MKKVLLIGTGLLGQSVKQMKPASVQLRTITRNPKDSDEKKADTTDFSVLKNEIESFAPDVLINCSALSAVDECEHHPDQARSVNALSVKVMAETCAGSGAYLIHISTDYVFSGSDEDLVPHRPVGPCSIYGMTKAEGEYYALNLTDRSCVIRTSWVFGKSRPNFVTAICEKLRNNEAISVISEQVGKATYAGDLSSLIWKITDEPVVGSGRILHFSNQEPVTRLEMVKEMACITGSESSIRPLDNGSPKSWVAVRPKRSVLDTSQSEQAIAISNRAWTEGFREFLTETGYGA